MSAPKHQEIVKPADAADYLHGEMPKYSTKGDGHQFTFRGRTTNLNTLPPFEDYDDETPSMTPGYDDEGE